MLTDINSPFKNVYMVIVRGGRVQNVYVNVILNLIMKSFLVL